MPDPTDLATLAVIAAAVAATLRGVDVRLALLAAALALGVLAGDLAPVAREFIATFSNEKFVVPICTSMGFAYVLKHTGCDTHLVRALVRPVRRVKPLMIPGVVGVGFLVNIPVISQTSTVVCLGTVVVPLMRAAGFSAAATGAALLLGSSVGGELLNPGAPELLSVKDRTGVDTRAIVPHLMPLVLPMLGVSAVVLWTTEWWRGRSVGWDESSSPTVAPPPKTVGLEDSSHPTKPINPLKALVPLVPLAILFLSGPPLERISIPQRWVVDHPPALASAAAVGPAGAATRDAKTDPKFSGRLIGLAMLIGVGVAAAVAPGKAGGCLRAFFDGAGYGFANIVSLIVTATCFGKGIEQVGLAKHLGDLIASEPSLLQPLAGLVPCGFAAVCGSGMASTQSLYGFFYVPAVEHGQNPVDVGALVSLGSAAGRTMSPVAAVTLMAATLTGATAAELVKRVAPPLLIGLAAVIGLRLAGVV